MHKKFPISHFMKICMVELIWYTQTDIW